MSVSPVYTQIDTEPTPIPTLPPTPPPQITRTASRVTWTNQRTTALIEAVNERIALFRERHKGSAYKNEGVKIRWQLIADRIRDLSDPLDPFSPADGACEQKYNKLKKTVSDYHKHVDKSGNSNVEPPWYHDLFMSKQIGNDSIVPPVVVSSSSGVHTTVTDSPRRVKKAKTRDDVIAESMQVLVAIEKQRNEILSMLLTQLQSPSTQTSAQQSHLADA